MLLLSGGFSCVVPTGLAGGVLLLSGGFSCVVPTGLAGGVGAHLIASLPNCAGVMPRD